MFGVALAPIREKLKPTFAPDVPELQQIQDALEIQEENLLADRLFNSGKKLHPDGVAIRVEMQSRRPVEERWLGDPMEREMYRAAKSAVEDGGGVLPSETLFEKSERLMREMGLDIEYTGEHQSAEALETAYDKLVVESDKMGDTAFEKDFQAHRQRTLDSIKRRALEPVREPKAIELQEMHRGPKTAQQVRAELNEPLLNQPLLDPETYVPAKPSRWSRFKRSAQKKLKEWDFLAPKERPGMLEEPLLGLQGKGNRLPLRTHLVAAEMKSAVQNLSQLEKDALEQGFKDSDIFFSGTGKELYLNFGKAIGKNVVLAAAMVALGFVVPKEVNRIVNYGFDAYAIVELLAGNPAMALMTGGMELWKEFGVQAKREKYNIESDRDHGKVFGYVRDGKTW